MQRKERFASIELGIGIIRVDLDCFAVAFQSLLVAAKIAQGVSFVVSGQYIFRLNFYRLVATIESLCKFFVYSVEAIARLESIVGLVRRGRFFFPLTC